MASIRVRKETGLLYFDFRFKGHRCREFTKLTDSVENRRKMEKMLKHIEAEITLGTFDYQQYFPNSKMLGKFDPLDSKSTYDEQGRGDAPCFKDFAEECFFLKTRCAGKKPIQPMCEAFWIIISISILAKKRSTASPRVKSSNSVRLSPKLPTEKGSHLTGSITSSRQCG